MDIEPTPPREPDRTPVTTGWETPGAAPAPVPSPAGDRVIAGPGARIVAYLIDATLTTAIPSIVSLLLVDLGGLIDDSIEAARAGVTAPTTIPITLDLALLTIIGVGIQFVYFVGSWTSGARATPGMRLLRMQVVDALDARQLSVEAAIRRWVLLGSPLALLSVIEPLQAAAGPLAALVLFLVFLTVVIDPRRQGFHDRAARSIVVRDPSSGNAATALGCLILLGMIAVLAVAAWIVLFAAIGSRLFDPSLAVPPI